MCQLEWMRNRYIYVPLENKIRRWNPQREKRKSLSCSGRRLWVNRTYLYLSSPLNTLSYFFFFLPHSIDRYIYVAITREPLDLFFLLLQFLLIIIIRLERGSSSSNSLLAAAPSAPKSRLFSSIFFVGLCADWKPLTLFSAWMRKLFLWKELK